MGWKRFKEHFNIRHDVQIKDVGLCIGSSLVSELIVINMTTGKLVANSTFHTLQQYPELQAATPAQILELLQAPDTFERSIPVYTYKDDQILEKFCEELGWPNVTHDGCMMYDNTTFTNREDAIKKAFRNARCGVENARDYVDRCQRDLLNAQAYLKDEDAILQSLVNAYPEQALADAKSYEGENDAK